MDHKAGGAQRRGREKLSTFGPLVRLGVRLFSWLPAPVLCAILRGSQCFRGLPGIGLRYLLIKNMALGCGDNVSIQPCVYLLKPENLRMGDNISVHPMSYIDATGGVTLGNDVSIAHGVTIMSTTHTFNRSDIPIKDQEVVKLATSIGHDVWIGAKATVVAGVRVGDHCVVAAGAVVTRDVPDWSIVAGVPARQIRTRDGRS